MHFIFTTQVLYIQQSHNRQSLALSEYWKYLTLTWKIFISMALHLQIPFIHRIHAISTAIVCIQGFFLLLFDNLSCKNIYKMGNSLQITIT